MLVSVYKSARKNQTYLYLAKKDDFSSVPKILLDTFGTPKFVMTIPLVKREKLAIIDRKKLQDELQQKGFYLQIPPPEENLLKQHLKSQQQNPD